MIASVFALSPRLPMNERQIAMIAIVSATLFSNGSLASGISGASGIASRSAFDRWIVDSERVRQIRKVLLFLRDNLSEHFPNSKLAHRFCLPDALPVMDDRLLLVLEIKAEHLFGFVGNLDLFGLRPGCAI